MSRAAPWCSCYGTKALPCAGNRRLAAYTQLFYFPTCLQAQSSALHPQTQESTQFSMQCFPPDRCFVFTAPAHQLPPLPSSALPSASSPCTALPCSTALFPGQDLGQVANQSERSVLLQGYGNCWIHTHTRHSAQVTHESFTSIHAKGSALFVAFWEAHGVIAGMEEALPAPLLCLSPPSSLKHIYRSPAIASSYHTSKTLSKSPSLLALTLWKRSLQKKS